MIDKNKLEEFKLALKVRLSLEMDDHLGGVDIVYKIPDEIYERLINEGFNGDVDLAKLIVRREFEKIDRSDLDSEIDNIENLNRCADKIADYMQNGKRVVFFTDTDNDGSSGRAIISTFKDSVDKNDLCKAEFTKVYPENPIRGISVELIEDYFNYNHIGHDAEILVLTVDNGVNSREEQRKILDRFPNIELVITDHHKPNAENVVIESERSFIVDPKVDAEKNPSSYFAKKNISGAQTVGEILTRVIEKINRDKMAIDAINRISYHSNSLDYVTSDIRHRSFDKVSEVNSLGVMLNVNNSLDKFINDTYSEREIDLICKEYDLDRELILDGIDNIKSQNVMAKSLCDTYKDFQLSEEKDSFTANRVSTDVINAIHANKEWNPAEDFNFNYISELRYILIKLECASGLSNYEEEFLDQGRSLFRALKKTENKMLKELREHDVVNFFEDGSSTFVLPKSKEVASVFNRKFLSKAYNLSNNGFICFLDKFEDNLMSGSFRSLHDIEEIFSPTKKAEIENSLGVSISWMGHPRAAGFFIENKTPDYELSAKDLADLNKFISQRCEELSADRNLSSRNFLFAQDLSTIQYFDKINEILMADTRNSTGLPVLVKIKPSWHVQDQKTLKVMPLTKRLEQEKYGYGSGNLSFDGLSLIAPVKVVQALKENNYKDYMHLTYMDKGAFMVSSIARFIDPKNITGVSIRKKNEDGYIQFYQEYYVKDDDKLNPNNYRTPYSNEDLMNHPYIKGYTKNGFLNFVDFENTIISLLDETKTDEFVTVDVEANGLGLAPELFNIGFFTLRIDGNSGKRVKEKTFKKNLFESYTGRKFLFTDGERENFLRSIAMKDYSSLSGEEKDRVLRKGDDLFVIMDGVALEDHEVRNFKKSGDDYIYNRSLEGESIAAFVKDHDVRVTEQMTNLTHLTNKMLNKLGVSSFHLDKILLEIFGDKKCIFQAHNSIGYDNNVINANLAEFSSYYNNSAQIDSTYYSRTQTLAYDDTDAISLKAQYAPNLGSVVFYCDPDAKNNFLSFLKNPEAQSYFCVKSDNRLLKQDGLLFVLKKDGTSIKLNRDLESLTNEVETAIKYRRMENSFKEMTQEEWDEYTSLGVKIGELPKNLKYGVVHLSAQLGTQLAVELMAEEIEREKVEIDVNDPKILFLFERFQDGYDFSKSRKSNIDNFKKSVDGEDLNLLSENNDIFLHGIEGFVEVNSALYDLYKDTWLYKEMLKLYHPEGDDDPARNAIFRYFSENYGISESAAKTMYTNIVKVMKDNGLDEIITHEMHNNIVHKVPEKYEESGIGIGDVVLESVTTTLLLLRRQRNNYDFWDKNEQHRFIRNALLHTVANVGKHRYSLGNSSTISQGSNQKRLQYTDTVKLLKKLDKDPNMAYYQKLPAKTASESWNLYTKELRFSEKDDIDQLIDEMICPLIEYYRSRGSLPHNPKAKTKPIVDPESRGACTEIIEMFESKAKELEHKIIERYGAIPAITNGREKLSDHLTEGSAILIGEKKGGEPIKLPKSIREDRFAYLEDDAMKIISQNMEKTANMARELKLFKYLDPDSGDEYLKMLSDKLRDMCGDEDEPTGKEIGFRLKAQLNSTISEAERNKGVQREHLVVDMKLTAARPTAKYLLGTENRALVMNAANEYQKVAYKKLREHKIAPIQSRAPVKI